MESVLESNHITVTDGHWPATHGVFKVWGSGLVNAACSIPWIPWKMLSRCPWASHLFSSRSSGGAQWVTHDWDCTQMSDVSGCALEKVAMGICWRVLNSVITGLCFWEKREKCFQQGLTKEVKTGKKRESLFFPVTNFNAQLEFQNPCVKIKVAFLSSEGTFDLLLFVFYGMVCVLFFPQPS